MKKFLVCFLSVILCCLPLSANTLKALYSSNNQTITLTITSLANTSLRQSTALDNTSNLYLDALVTCKIKSGSATAGGYVAIYAYGTTNGGTDYDGGASGTDGSYTKDVTPPNIPIIGIMTLNASTVTVRRTFSVAAAYGGQLPDHWGIIVENQSGATLDGTTASCWYQGINAQTQ